MCPNCRAFISISDRVCPYCEVQLGPRIVDTRPSQSAGSFMPRLTNASIAVLLINLIWFGLEIFVGWFAGRGVAIENVSVDLGFSYAPYVLHGQWWRLITAGFLHGGIIHIAMNSYALLILVTESEQFYGLYRFIVAYVFSTFTGFLASCLVHPFTPSLGASAAAFGLMGLMLAMTVGRRVHPVAHLVKAQYTQWVLFGLVMSFLPFSHVDWAAHIGGLAGGFLVGIVAGLPGLPGSSKENFWRVGAGITVALTLYCFFRDFAFVYHALGSRI